MSHHGWIPVTGASVPAALLSPFGRLFPARGIGYNSHAVALLAGAMGPLQERVVRDATGAPVLENGDVKTITVFAAPDKAALPTGFTFLGQFIDHDMTEFRVATPDLALLLQNPTIDQRQRVHEDGPPTATNGRSGRLDLDSVYGLLHGIDLHLFDEAGRFKLHPETGVATDIVRDVDYRDGRLIADPRNDENKIIVQLHVLFERLHNKVHGNTAAIKDEDKRRQAIAKTRTDVANAYRRIILYDYLPKVVGVGRVLQVWQQIRANTSFYQKMNRRVRNAVMPMLESLVDGIPGHDGKPTKAPEVLDQFLRSLVAMPVEFAHAAFRLGHSQLRDAYKLNGGSPVPLFFTGPTSQNQIAGPDLRGNMAIQPATQIEWTHLFGPSASRGRPLDANLPASIFRLPPPTVGEPPVSLAERNIRRGADFGLPSGQEAARLLGTAYSNVPILSPDEILPATVLDYFPELRTIDAQFAVSTPLWFYILREASIEEPIEAHLGSVGGLIVAETLLGSLAATDGFDLTQHLGGGYEQRVNAAAASGAAAGQAQNVGAINSMRQMLHFIGSPVG